jgi:hypothetical protein
VTHIYLSLLFEILLKHVNQVKCLRTVPPIEIQIKTVRIDSIKELDLAGWSSVPATAGAVILPNMSIPRGFRSFI